jgi:hypothetical protein
MTQRGVRHAPIDIRYRGEGRVHQNHAWRDGVVEVVVDLRRVEARHADVWEEAIEQRGAGLGQLVQHERSAGDLGEHGEEPRASGGLQNAVGVRDAGGR